jgi:hypothetical protein
VGSEKPRLYRLYRLPRQHADRSVNALLRAVIVTRSVTMAHRDVKTTAHRRAPGGFCRTTRSPIISKVSGIAK